MISASLRIFGKWFCGLASLVLFIFLDRSKCNPSAWLMETQWESVRASDQLKIQDGMAIQSQKVWSHVELFHRGLTFLASSPSFRGEILAYLKRLRASVNSSKRGTMVDSSSSRPFSRRKEKIKILTTSPPAAAILLVIHGNARYCFHDS